MPSIVKPIQTQLIFARFLSQEEFERLEGVTETDEGPQPFTSGDFLMHHRGKYYLIRKEQMEREYHFSLGSRTSWGCYKALR